VSNFIDEENRIVQKYYYIFEIVKMILNFGAVMHLVVCKKMLIF